MTHITKGANTPVPAALLRVAVCRQHVPGAPAVDASALLLDAAGKVRGDADLVFYNQPAHPSGAVRHAGTAEGGGQLAEWLEVDLPRVEPSVQRVLIAGSCDGGVFGQVPGLHVQALTAEGMVVAHYTVSDARNETAFVLGEFYRRNGQWKFRAVGQGYASGLAGLATDFGIAVAEPAPPAAAPTAAVPFPTPAPAPAPAIAPPAPAFAPTAAAFAAPPPVTSPVAAPVDAAPRSLGPEFPPYTQRGQGNGVVSVDAPLPPGPVVVEAWHQGEGYFGMHTLNRRNKDDDLLANSTLRDFRCRVLVQPPKDRPLRLRVEADNDWTVLVQPLSVLRHLGPGPLHGYGPEVVAYTGPVADLDVDFAGDEDGGGYFGLWSLEASRLHDLDDRDLLVNDTDRLRQTVPIADGPLLLLLEADGAWQLDARPLHTPGTATAQADGVHTGRGEKTLTLVNPTPGRPALLEYACPGSDGGLGHRLVLVDEYDDEEDLVQGYRHGAHGRTLLFTKGEPQVRLRLADVGDWSLRLLPVEQAPLLTGPAEGRGSTVFRYEGPPALLGLCRTVSGDQVVTTRTVQADGRSKVSADTKRRRPVTGPLWVTQAGHCYVQVWTTDETGWRIEPAGLATVPVLDRAPVEGQGYGVVRNAGPEAEVMVQHDALGGATLPVLWELDERLEPVRRISTASGLQRVPSGYLQIRTSGRWALEPRG
ncbi:TerD family protein [Streptomyces sp. SID5910]|uniref:TerD family protein n=1 Tax=Streptomyces sp. SID5910 TaxID=2690312 RepID=UPI001F48A595|nr:TerD family protein [Streptomyces sp. SID5910]